MAPWDQQCLGSARTQAPSLAQHSGSGLGLNYGWDLIPGLRTPYAMGCPKTKNKQTNKTKTEKDVYK